LGVDLGVAVVNILIRSHGDFVKGGAFMTRVAPILIFVLAVAVVPVLGQQGLPSSASLKGSPDCKMETLPSEIQTRLKQEFASWKMQESTDLSPSARERWKAEKPLGCPGVAVGAFRGSPTPSYAVLLVRTDHPDVGYRFLIFDRQAGKSSFGSKVIEKSDDSGASNFFVRKTRISKFFDLASRRKFQVQANDGVLLADAGEKEYEVEVYFWTSDGYQHQPVDY